MTKEKPKLTKPNNIESLQTYTKKLFYRLLNLTTPIVGTILLATTTYAQTLLPPTIETNSYHPIVHVSPNGNDKNNGSKASPLASLTAARNAIRTLKKTNSLDNGATVLIQGGRYELESTFMLGSLDSGKPGAPINYRAAQGQKVSITGGKKLQTAHFNTVIDNNILNRLSDQTVTGKLLEFDLAAAGITDYGQLSRRGFNLDSSPQQVNPQMELIIDKQIMTLAQWPNTGSVSFNKVIDKGPKRGDSDFWERGGTFGYTFNRATFWSNAKDIWLEGTFNRDWEWSHNKVASINPLEKTITLAYGEVSGIQKTTWNEPFFVVKNLLEEIDQPGEYYIDRNQGKLYLYPPKGFNENSQVTVTSLQEDMIRLHNANHIRFQNLIIEEGREHGIYGTKTHHLEVIGTTFRNLGEDGLRMVGTNNTLRDSHMYNLGARGVLALADWRWPINNDYTLEGNGNTIANNTFKAFGRITKAYAPGIDIDGAGVKVQNNLVHEGSHMGIMFRGNNHLIEKNEIFDIGRNFEDIGAIYANLGKTPGERGTVIRQNFIHHIGQNHDQMYGVYFDNGTMGATVEDNIFYQIGSDENPNCAAIVSNQGQHLTLRNNMFIDTVKAFRLSLYMNCDAGSWGCSYQKSFQKAWDNFFTNMPSMLSQAYPELNNWYQEDHWQPTSNSYTNNVAYNPTLAISNPRARNSIRGDAYEVNYVTPNSGFSLKQSGNFVAKDNPGFVDIDNMNFNQLPQGEMFNQNTELDAIAFDEIGVKKTK